MISQTQTAWVALSLVKSIGGVTFAALLAHFNHDLDAVLKAPLKVLCQVRGIGKTTALAIQKIDLEATARIMERWQKSGVHILTRNDSLYPRALKRLNDAPPTLFGLGNIDGLAALQGIAVVGTRHPSEKAKQMAETLAGEIIQQGYAVISGLAYGVDSIAHLSALAGGRTFAVLGSGVLNIYPADHDDLAQAIMRQGALLCEVAPDSPVSTPGLVARNRIISGLSMGVIIVETDHDGGAMHAARFARAQDRRLYVVDFPASGNQALLKDGAIKLPVDFNGLVLQDGF
ncbi:MAG: DNA-processing protein DprA [Chitinophagaceae bacterium]|nr:DNA-processing protein DprA [Anaerolineae bacterium]